MHWLLWLAAVLLGSLALGVLVGSAIHAGNPDD